MNWPLAFLNGLHHPSWMDSSGGDEKQRRLVRRLLLASIRNCLWNSSHIQKVPDNQPGGVGSFWQWQRCRRIFFSRKSYQGWGWDCWSLKALSLRLKMISCFSGFARWWHAEYYSLGFLHWRSRFAFLHGNRPLHQLLGFDKGLERGMGRNQEELGIKIKKALWESRKKMHGSSLAILLFRRPWEGIFLGLSDAIS